ncbi:YfcC family protein [Acidaminococcus fermentans]|uniref:YfcC family protein n=1 Tax=Acidaminococcus fermentans TaxID=905 RepID=UPI003D05201C
MAEEKKSGFRLHALNPMVLLGIIMFLAFLASYIVPAGEYSRVLNPVLNKEVVDPATFHYIQQQPVSPFYLFQSLTLGLQNAAEIISFLFIIGGMFAIMDATGAINAGLSNVVEKMKGRELLMIPVVMVLFSLLSAFAGCFEEFLAFTPLVIGVSVAMGFDSLTAIAIVFCAAPVGYAGAMTNPFTVGVAQGICGLPMFSGMGLRAVLFVVMNIVTIPYVMWYANKVRKNPELSTVREEDLLYNSHLKLQETPVINLRHKLVLVLFVATIATVVLGVLKFDFYINEMAGLFLLCGILAGCSNMLFANLVIGMCNGAVLIMQNAHIMDTVIHYMASMLNGLPPTLSACGMFIVQDLFNVLVPSGSGKAAITMPLFAPLADLIGVTRQTAVLAFQMGDAFTNVFAPTSGEVVAACAMAHISFGKWFRWLAPLFAIWCVVAMVFMVIAVQIHYGPF